jgi:hypothetical protein
MKLTSASLFLLGFYIALVLFWLCAGLFANGGSPVTIMTIFSGFKHSTQYGYIFGFAYSFIPLAGSLVGFNITRKWGFSKSSVGKAVFYLSLSLLLWAIGEFIWSYYNFFLNANVPYPSWADAAFILTYPLWAIGMIYFGIASGANLGLKKMSGKLLLVIVPILVLLLSWYVMVVLARGGSITSGGDIITVFFDIAYPVGDAIILTMAFLIFGLSFRYWGGQIKWPVIIIIIGFLVEYIADFGFSYTTAINTYYNGSWVDLLFATSLTILGLGVAMLDIKEAPKSASTAIPPAAPSSPTNTSSVPSTSPTV